MKQKINPLNDLLNSISSKDVIINWMEDQDNHLIFKIAQNLNNSFQVPLWTELELKTDEDLLYDIENTNCITVEILKSAILESVIYKQ